MTLTEVQIVTTVKLDVEILDDHYAVKQFVGCVHLYERSSTHDYSYCYQLTGAFPNREAALAHRAMLEGVTA